MIISFDTRELQQCCSNLAIAEHELGIPHAQSLMAMIADAEAFDNAEQLFSFHDKAAQVSEGDSLKIIVGGGYTAEFVAVGIQFRRHDNGRVDWASVQRLKLLKLMRLQ